MKALGETIRQAMESGRPSAPPAHAVIPTARDIMTTKLICFELKQSLGEAIGILLKHSISGAPVVDEHGKLVGILSEADCMRDLAVSHFHEHGNPLDRTVEELMSRSLTTITPETDIFSIADRFLSAPLRRLPVVCDGELQGQVSRRDVLRAMKRMW